MDKCDNRWMRAHRGRPVGLKSIGVFRGAFSCVCVCVCVKIDMCEVTWVDMCEVTHRYV